LQGRANHPLEDDMGRAQKIMVIRHGEKPQGAIPPYGVTTDGEQDANSLLVQGWARAGALAVLFAPSRGELQSEELAQPQTIFAASDVGGQSSKRPEETVSFVAQKLSLDVNTAYTVGQETQLADAVKSCDGVVLIGWEHKHIPLIANAILGNTSAPQQWAGDRFDMVWVFDFDAGGGTWRFSQVPELLMPGDSAEPIPT
jgi:hypothetical protein